jgi:hypothetical protein
MKRIHASFLGVPAWAWAVIGVIAVIEPLLHVWMACFPPEGTAHTGLNTADTVVFLNCMRMFETDFHSPYATCKAPLGSHYIGYYAVPFFWMYGAVGSLGRFLQVAPFIMLGLANGVAGLLYLVVVFRFLAQVVPRQAGLAFLIYALRGGLGGVLYLVTGLAGLHDAAAFDDYFLRFALYDIMEGNNFSAALQLPRLYYTVPLAMCLGGLTLFLRTMRTERHAQMAFALALMGLGSFFNVRLSAMTWAVGGLYLCSRKGLPLRRRLAWTAAMGPTIVAGCAAALAVIHHHPTLNENASAGIRESMWFSAFAAAFLLQFLVVPREIGASLSAFGRFGRTAAWAGIGYLAAFAGLFLAYQAYYGNLLIGRDHAAAVAVSDWALIGAALGVAYALVRRASPPLRPPGDVDQNGWVVLWMLLFVSVAISAWGGGWFLRLVPQRLVAMIGFPICILTAQGIQRLRDTSPRHAKVLLATMLACGICSIAVASLFSQGPLWRKPGEGPFAYQHSESMTEADARVLARLGEGTVLAPYVPGPYFGDVIALMPNRRVIQGMGTLNFGDQPSLRMDRLTSQFFSTNPPEGFNREAFVDEWCVDYVYCPDTHPVDPAVIAELRRSSRFEVVASDEKAVLFSVPR